MFRALPILMSAFLVFGFGVAGSNAQESKLDEKDLDAFIEKTREEYNVPGVSVTVVEDGEVVYLKGFGVRKVGTQEKVDENTIFQLASVTKTFTSAAIGTFVDDGKVTWDEEVIDVLPGFALMQPYPTRYSTPRDLLAHRTGLPAFGGDLLGNLGYDREQVLYRVRLIEPSHSFREEATYSNIGFFIAGQVAGKLGKTTWEDVVNTRLIKPLEMNRTGFPGMLDKENVASPHAKIDGEIQAIPWNRGEILGAAGDMVSTGSDMSKWMITLLDGGTYKGKGVLKPETIKDMFAPSMVETPGFAELPPISEKTGFSFGMGWGSYHWKNHEIVEKGGGYEGIRTVVVLVPELNLGITVLSNLNFSVLPEAIRAYILEQYLGKADYDMQAEIKKRMAMLDKLTAVGSPPESPKPPSQELRAYVGNYENQLYGTFKVVQEKKDLRIEAGPGKYPGKLEHLNYDSYILRWPSINMIDEITFVTGPSGEIEEFISDAYGTFKRVKDQ